MEKQVGRVVRGRGGLQASLRGIIVTAPRPGVRGHRKMRGKVVSVTTLNDSSAAIIVNFPPEGVPKFVGTAEVDFFGTVTYAEIRPVSGEVARSAHGRGLAKSPGEERHPEYDIGDDPGD